MQAQPHYLAARDAMLRFLPKSVKVPLRRIAGRLKEIEPRRNGTRIINSGEFGTARLETLRRTREGSAFVLTSGHGIEAVTAMTEKGILTAFVASKGNCEALGASLAPAGSAPGGKFSGEDINLRSILRTHGTDFDSLTWMVAKPPQTNSFELLLVPTKGNCVMRNCYAAAVTFNLEARTMSHEIIYISGL